MIRKPAGRRIFAGLFLPALVACACSFPVHGAAVEATTSDGRFRIVESGAGELSVLSAVDGRELRRIPLLDRRRQPGHLAWALDLPRRKSLVVGFADLPEVWELLYGEKSEPVYDGLVHDYRMGEGLADRGPLPMRRIPLEAPVPKPEPDERQVHLTWPDPAHPGKLNVLNLDVRRVIAQVDAPQPKSDAVAPAAARSSVERIDRLLVIAAASRVEERIDSVPATVSVVERKDVFREVAGNLRDVFRYEPGISMESFPTRFGLGNLSIRGLDGNRVQMTLDGIRLPESYRVGSFSNASRNALGLGLLRQVEVVRGPSSAIHGSDALAGVVAFTTLDPGPYLRDGKAFGGEAFGAYQEADRSTARGGVLSLDAGSTQLLLGAERVDGRETRNRGDVAGTGSLRTLPNPQDTRSESQLAKWVVPMRSGVRLTLTADRYARDTFTDVLSLNPQSSRTVSLTGDDRSRRKRYSAEAVAYDAGPLSRLSVTFYAQDSLTQQDTAELRTNTTAACLSTPGTVSCLREPRFRYEAAERGFVAIGEAKPQWGGLAHGFVLGAEASRTKGSESRDGRQTNLNTGAVSTIVGGEALPTRDFPLTDTDRFGAFVQDSAIALDPRLTWVPGIRFDMFRLHPRLDDVFTSGNPGRPVASLSDEALSPKLGLLFRASDALTLTGQLATGLRAPPAADLNIGLTSLPAGYTVIPNPDLRPERSRGAEIGMRWNHAALEGAASAYYTRYQDLIVSRTALACPADPQCVAGATGTFQSRNISSARIYGVEAKVAWRFAKGWTARAALSVPRGDDLGKGAPLNSIDPARLVAGAAYETQDWGASVHFSHAREQTRVDRSAGVNFVPPAWTTVDITGWWKPYRELEIAAGIFNVGDRKYWLWSDVRGLANVTTGFDRYTQPGRTAGVNARWLF